jgi:hypothetical protein
VLLKQRFSSLIELTEACSLIGAIRVHLRSGTHEVGVLRLMFSLPLSCIKFHSNHRAPLASTQLFPASLPSGLFSRGFISGGVLI